MKLEFPVGHPMRALADGQRWLHVCEPAMAVFGVLAPHACPLCKAECPPGIEQAALEKQRQNVVEHHAVD